MKIILTILLLVSLYFNLPAEKPSGGILGTVLSDLPEKSKQVKQKAAVVKRRVRENEKFKFGEWHETIKSYDHKDSLISEENFKGVKPYGPQKFYENSKLVKSQWYFGPKKRDSVSIIYDQNGKVIRASCHGRKFTEEHEVVCGFRGPYEFSAPFGRGKTVTVLLNGKLKSTKNFNEKGQLWYERNDSDKGKDIKIYREGVLRNERFEANNGFSLTKEYYENGKIHAEINSRIIADDHVAKWQTYDKSGAKGGVWEVRRNFMDGIRCKKISKSKLPPTNEAIPQVCRY